MDQDATSIEVGLGPIHIVLDGAQLPPLPPKGAQQPPLFSPCLLLPNGCPSQQLLSSCYWILLSIFAGKVYTLRVSNTESKVGSVDWVCYWRHFKGERSTLSRLCVICTLREANLWDLWSHLYYSFMQFFWRCTLLVRWSQIFCPEADVCKAIDVSLLSIIYQFVGVIYRDT